MTYINDHVRSRCVCSRRRRRLIADRGYDRHHGVLHALRRPLLDDLFRDRHLLGRVDLRCRDLCTLRCLRRRGGFSLRLPHLRRRGGLRPAGSHLGGFFRLRRPLLRQLHRGPRVRRRTLRSGSDLYLHRARNRPHHHRLRALRPRRRVVDLYELVVGLLCVLRRRRALLEVRGDGRGGWSAGRHAEREEKKREEEPKGCAAGAGRVSKGARKEAWGNQK